jgi:hypothetical protein
LRRRAVVRSHPFFQQGIVTAFRVPHTRLLRQRHGAFTQTFEYQIVNVAFFGELDRGLDAIARIACAGTYTNGAHHFSR